MGSADVDRAELEPAGADEPTREQPSVPAAASEDRCGACGTSLAHDQRYCVECGERRGQSRFPVTEPTTEIRTTRTRSIRPRRSSTVSSGTTLVAGVGVLLLAIGLGVLIGRLGTKTPAPARAAAPQVITVQGGGGVAASTPTTRTTVHVNKKTKAKLNAAAKATAPPSAAVQKKATEAAGKVLGSSKNLPPPTSTIGQKCTGNQSGCSGGKFTGNYFPGG
ncbi:MAG TPA: hypothetical protein VFH80_06310 [Solirubrobacteraceae bacterium]|nr:hypothetical protein [Solirubrobacteraceae bacterium]